MIAVGAFVAQCPILRIPPLPSNVLSSGIWDCGVTGEPVPFEIDEYVEILVTDRAESWSALPHVRNAATIGMVALALVVSGCVAPYNTTLNPDISQWRDRVQSLGTAYDDEEMHLSESWVAVQATCDAVLVEMRREVDQINSRNTAIEAVFGAVTAAASFGALIYNLAVDEPEPLVTAVLAGTGGASTVPTFLFLGTDEREAEVRQRIQSIEDGRDTVNSALRDLQASFLALIAVQQRQEEATEDREQMEAAHRARESGDGEADVPFELLEIDDIDEALRNRAQAVHELDEQAEEAQESFYESQHRFWNALQMLQRRCR